VHYLERVLEEELEARTEEHRRHDILMAQLMQRIPELEAPREPREAAERHEEEPEREEAPACHGRVSEARTETVVAQGVRRVSPRTIGVGVFTIVGPVGGAFVGLLGGLCPGPDPPGVLHAHGCCIFGDQGTANSPSPNGPGSRCNTPQLLGRHDALFTNFCQGECFRYLRKGQALHYLVELLLRVRLSNGQDNPLPHRIAGRDNLPLRLELYEPLDGGEDRLPDDPHQLVDREQGIGSGNVHRHDVLRHHAAIMPLRGGARCSGSPYSPKWSMALARPPRSHENGAAAKAIFTPVPGRSVLRTSPCTHSRKSTSSIMHSPGPIQRGVLCRVSKVYS
jgi:hypothetical protein